MNISRILSDWIYDGFTKKSECFHFEKSINPNQYLKCTHGMATLRTAINQIEWGLRKIWRGIQLHATRTTSLSQMCLNLFIIRIVAYASDHIRTHLFRCYSCYMDIHSIRIRCHTASRENCEITKWQTESLLHAVWTVLHAVNWVQQLLRYFR